MSVLIEKNLNGEHTFKIRIIKVVEVLQSPEG
jgi:hypothetical protein